MSPKFFKILTIVLAVMLAGLIIYTVFQKPPQQEDNGYISRETETFTHVFVTGYEGVYPEVTVKLDYDPKVIDLRSFGAEILLHNKNTDQIGSIRVISNDGPGFSSPKQAFEEMHYCDTCAPKTVDINFKNASDILAFESEKESWYIFAHDPGFVVMRIPKPDTEVKKILPSLTVSTRMTNTMPEQAVLKVYFTNDKIKPVKNCTEVVPVERYYTKTSQVATFAILSLLNGLYQNEIDAGYTTNIPKGVWLNSIRVEDSVAYVDFSKKLEEGGGSCHMTALRSQIEQTLLEFPTVKSVQISVEGRTGDILQP
ncbi:MAG: sporulation/spore germination protein [Parcubacteria group bacterium Gr01-1014_20]|nr:MAG: sporulation/spore germination protein [Parcubacteria group bacterium Gr01-1014_20]